MKYSRRFFKRDTKKVAKKLLGSYLFTNIDGKITGGRIVETEAYLGEEDKASHARAGKTKRTETMYGPPGHAYIYLVYGLHHQFNVVTREEGNPQAVLIRALEPVEGIDIMKGRRGREDLCTGPGKLCEALGITKDLNKENLRGDNIWIKRGRNVSKNNIVESKRIGIDYAEDHADWLCRFHIKDNQFVSK